MAVLVILSLATSLAVGTVLESLYDTPTAQYWVYRSVWFSGILALLGVNIFCVAMSRWPWKKKHVSFLLAHLGILILLAGAWITEKDGIDGSLRITEGENSSYVSLDTAFLGVELYKFALPWIPPGVQFRPKVLSENGIPEHIVPGIVVDQYISHADPIIQFVPEQSEHPTEAQTRGAIKLRIKGGVMKISQELWLWQGSADFNTVQAGPARFSIQGSFSSDPVDHNKDATGPSLAFVPQHDGSLSYLALASASPDHPAQGSSPSNDSSKITKNARRSVSGRLAPGKIKGAVLDLGWKGGVQVIIEDWVPHAKILQTFKPSRIQYGQMAPPPAIHLGSKSGPLVDVWLGLGDSVTLYLPIDFAKTGSSKLSPIDITYYSRRIVLPFSLRLDRFSIEHDQGTFNPAAYSSRVTVTDSDGQKDVLISMNEPLEHRGFTFYQASYEDADPRPVTSILTVNRDRGRTAKYLGSALIVLGSILLFVQKLKKARVENRSKSEVFA